MYDWKLNASTGNHIASLKENTRLIRLSGGGLYLAEYWGDYSLRYPINGGWAKTPAKALDQLARRRRSEGLPF